MTQILAYQLLVLHLKCYALRESRQSQRTCGLGLFPPCLSYSGGQWSHRLCSSWHWAGARAAKKHSCVAQLHPGPSQDDGGGGGRVPSARDVLWTPPSPAFAAVLRKTGTKLPVLPCTRLTGFLLQPNALQRVCNLWFRSEEKGKRIKMQINARGSSYSDGEC